MCSAGAERILKTSKKKGDESELRDCCSLQHPSYLAIVLFSFLQFICFMQEHAALRSQ